MAERTWTPERVDNLKSLWAKGLSAAQISGQLRGVSRNAVIGKIHRLGLPGRNTTIRQKYRSAGLPRTNKSRLKGESVKRRVDAVIKRIGLAPEPFEPAPEVVDVPLDQRRKLDSIGDMQCRWIVGDPKTAHHHFCHHQKYGPLAYCPAHMRMAYHPPTVIRREKVKQRELA